MSSSLSEPELAIFVDREFLGFLTGTMTFFDDCLFLLFLRRRCGLSDGRGHDLRFFHIVSHGLGFCELLIIVFSTNIKYYIRFIIKMADLRDHVFFCFGVIVYGGPTLWCSLCSDMGLQLVYLDQDVCKRLLWCRLGSDDWCNIEGAFSLCEQLRSTF